MIPLNTNPVWRSYRGGRILREFRGQPDTEDDHFPEDWIASCVLARNGDQSQGPREGISRIRYGGEEIELPTLRERAPEFFPSSSQDGFGVLIKLLDAADRLHIQAHPDDDFVRARLNGTLGKTECWYILSTRGDAHVHLGFQRPPSRDGWRKMVAEQDLDAIMACFDPIPVSPGDCLVVPAGVPHAIGAGIFMLEIQQPSDWVVRCEFSASGHTLPESARFMGLSLEECLDLFDYSAHAPTEFRQRPALVQESPDFTEESVIAPEYARFFQMRRLRGRGSASFQLPDPSVLIVSAGEGTLSLGEESSALGAGATFLLPAHSSPAHWRPTNHGDWELLIAQPPTQTH